MNMAFGKFVGLVARSDQSSAESRTIEQTVPVAYATTSQSRNGEPLGARRFAFVDALRGIAALGVAAYHIDRYGPLPGAASAVVPKFITSTLHHGWVGVQMFFVISGFVIAYTLRGLRVTPSSLGNFALRRSLRLDPPYWLTMLFVIGLYVLTTSLFDIKDGLIDEAPTWDQVLAHLFYLQNIVGYHNLSAGFWTLCIEVQFYILFAVMLGFAQRLTAHCSDRAEGAHWLPLLLTYAPLAVASLFWFSNDPDNTNWVIHFFAFFFFGALTWWTVEGRVPKPAFWTFAAAILLRQWIHGTLDMWVALATGLAIYGVISTGRSDRWLRFRWLQRLGLISYSLYLIHYPVSWIITSLGYELTGTAPVAATFWLVLSLVASIGVANALHAAIELPAIRFARRFGGSGSDRRIAVRPLPVLAEPLR
jgi:peptidoglycan/LPS O-acetylase OafA/YrhL